jgi:hypothetical protein
MSPKRTTVAGSPKESVTKILFANVCNLDNNVRRRFETMIINGEVDIIFAVETWQKDFTTKSTNTVLNKKAYGHDSTNRPQNGMEVIAHPRLHNQFTVIPLESDHILKMRFGEDIISLIYAPPLTMTTQSYQELLEMTCGSDLILGDFNSPLQLESLPFYENNPMTRVKKERAIVNEKFMEKERLETASIPFQGKTSPLDHILVKDVERFQNYTFINRINAKPIINSDHGILKLEWIRQKGKLGENTRRFRVKKLKDPKKVQELCKNFDEICEDAQLDDIFQTMVARTLVSGISRSEVEWIVDNAEKWIHMAAQKAAEKTIGSFVAKEAVTTKDDYMEILLTGDEELVEIQRYLAVKSRGRSPKLVSTTKGMTAIEEMEKQFNQVYKETIPLLWEKPMIHTKQKCSDVSQKRIKQCINNYPNGKAPGPDGIAHVIYKSLINGSKLQLHMKQLFKMILNSGYTPSRWNLSKIFPLPKGESTGKTHPAMETRPVALTAMMRRYFEKYLLIEWKSIGLCEHDKNQAGFREGYSTFSHAILANTTQSKLKVYLDVSKAYDKLSHKFLQKVMEERKVPRLHQLLVQSLMSNCKSIIVVNGCLTQCLPRDCGVFQGSIISPTIFNWTMDKLAKSLHDVCGTRDEPAFLFYADDVLLCEQGYQLDKTQVMLDTCQSWAQEAGLTFGIKKCSTQGIKKEDSLYIGNDRLDEAAYYKYLGFDMDKNGIEWQRSWERHFIGSCKYINFLIATRTQILPERHRCNIIKTYVESRLRYPLGLWTLAPDKNKDEEASIMEKICNNYNQSLNYIFGFDYSTTRIIQANLIGMMEPKVFIQVVQAQIIKHITNLDAGNPLKLSLSSGINKHPMLEQIRKLLRKSSKTTQQIKEDAIKDQFKRSNLIRYMQDSPRTKNGRDWTVEIANRTHRRQALQIRTGYLFRENDPNNWICHDCNQAIKRTHWNSCDALATLIPAPLLYDFQITKLERFNGKKDKFTLFDYLLNAQKLEIVVQLLEIIQLRQNSS